MAAAEAVAYADVELLSALVDKSLVQRTVDGRFRLLETVRAYGEQRLADEGATESTRQGELDWLLETIESFTIDEVVFRAEGAYSFLRSELENLYSAMAWAADRERWPDVARLASYVGLTGGLTGHESFRPVIAYVIGALDHGVDGALRDRTLAALTNVAYLDVSAHGGSICGVKPAASGQRGDDAIAVVALTWVANALDGTSRVAGDRAGVDLAQRLVERAWVIARELGRDWEALPRLVQGSPRSTPAIGLARQTTRTR